MTEKENEYHRQIGALLREMDRMRPVVQAAERQYDLARAPDEDGEPIECDCDTCTAVRAYRAAGASDER